MIKEKLVAFETIDPSGSMNYDKVVRHLQSKCYAERGTGYDSFDFIADEYHGTVWMTHGGGITMSGWRECKNFFLHKIMGELINSLVEFRQDEKTGNFLLVRTLG